MSRLISWLSTKNGKRFTYFCVGAAAMVVSANHIVINGLLLDRLKEIVQVYSRGKPKPLPPKVNELIEEVLNDCKLKEKKEKIKFFYVVGHELFHAGGIDSPWGAILGIPFTFENMQDINLGELKLHGRESIDWIIDGQDLVKALTLSDSAKKFALMREIYSCDFSDILINAVIGGGCILVPARLAQAVNIRSNAFERLRLGQRNIRYLTFYLCGFIFYRLLKDPLKHISEMKADKSAAETGPEYLSGGIEYYKKQLMKNKAIQDLSNSRYWKHYDEHGSENYFILAPKLPISKRLDLLRDMRKEKMVKAEGETSE